MLDSKDRVWSSEWVLSSLYVPDRWGWSELLANVTTSPCHCQGVSTLMYVRFVTTHYRLGHTFIVTIKRRNSKILEFCESHSKKKFH